MTHELWYLPDRLWEIHLITVCFALGDNTNLFGSHVFKSN